jgi:bifunctional enzyme CysN/CysC
LPLRFPVQDVYKFDERRIIAGRIESGSLRVGDRLLFSPRNRLAQVRSIEWFGAETPKTEAHAGESVGITIDEHLFIERGHVASHEQDAPVLTNQFTARIIWLGEQALAVGKRYRFKLATSEYDGTIRSIVRVVDTETLGDHAGGAVDRNSVAEVVVHIHGQAAVDDAAINPRMGRFVIVDGYDVVGGGIISLDGVRDQRVAARQARSENITPVELALDAEVRAQHNGHRGGILWMTGLSGAGKSTLATMLAKRLFDRGFQVYVLDGDNLRRGLNSDLGFSPEDRAENIRRVGEVAALFADAGMVVISALISPYRHDRDVAKNAAPQQFHTIYIKAGVETCEQRDVKGLYKKARAGEIQQFTGVSAPYEPPENPELVVDTEALSKDECLALLEDYVEQHLVESLKR